MTEKKQVRVTAYLPQSLQIAYNPKTGVANAAMSFVKVRRKKQ